MFELPPNGDLSVVNGAGQQLRTEDMANYMVCTRSGWQGKIANQRNEGLGQTIAIAKTDTLSLRGECAQKISGALLHVIQWQKHGLRE